MGAIDGDEVWNHVQDCLDLVLQDKENVLCLRISILQLLGFSVDGCWHSKVVLAEEEVLEAS